MPAGIEASIEDGFATLDFLDRSLVGPALEALRQAGSKVSKETRVGPRARYTMPEGDAIAAGLIDGATTMKPNLAYGDTGFADTLQSVGNEGSRPEAPTSRNLYSAATPAAAVMAIPGPRTTVSGKVPEGAIIAPLHGSIKKYGDYSLPQPHEPADCIHPGDGSGSISDGVIDFVEPTRIHSKAPQRPTTTSHITLDVPPGMSVVDPNAPGSHPIPSEGNTYTAPVAPTEPPTAWPTPMPTAPPADSAVTADYPAGVPDESWTVAQMRDYADDNDINLHGATKKADILAAIETPS
jgi:hypothetical protein